jgi:cell surface protein SprA
LIFPRTEPFREGIRQFFLRNQLTIAQADSFIYAEVYDTTFNGASNSQRNKFLIRGSTSSAMASTYQVGFNIVEGSVKVIVNGNQAQLNTDYSVDYISGTVTIKNQALLVPGANLQIQYEANDLLQLASKSLLGARADLMLGRNSSFGFTVMNLSQQSLSDKVRLGEEPSSNTIFGFDGGTMLDLDFLTRAVNWLPGVHTNATSNISFKGEAAYMRPNPNTRTSPISIDHGASVAYIDDFEGARKTIPLGSSYGGWRDASVPEFIPGLDDPVKLTNAEKMEYKAKLVWYSVLPSDVRATDIWPNKSVRAGEDQVTVLNLWYRPHERAPYNYSMDLDTKLRANPQKTWSGIQRLIGSTATNLLDENIGFIELWVHLNSVPPTAKLNIDLGLISEDVIPDNKLGTEDGIDGGIINTGILRPGEDVGIDGLSDDQEKAKYADFIAKYPEYSADPSGDNWVRPVAGSVDSSQYDGINGTEANAQSDVGRFPDTEDLNRNNVLDRTNSYFEYEVPLDPTNKEFQQLLGGGNNGWYQIRIPLNEFKRTVGDPSFGTVESIRLWLTGAQKAMSIRIAEFNLVGNQWEELVKNDSTFRVSVVNVEDNPDYQSPPSLPRQRDPSQPDQPILLNEQSLNLIVSGLKDGESRQALKRFPTRPLDLFSYRAMRMFVHGDERSATRAFYVDTTRYGLEIFLRFGSDSLNYYEYRAPIQPGWDPNDVNISFAELTAIKQLGRDSLTLLSPRRPVPGGPPGATYQVKGSPTLTNIRQIVIGVENPANKGPSVVTTDVWVNELRLTDVDNAPGWAYRFDTAIKIADIASVTFNMTQRDPNFHSLEDRFGTRNQDRNWALSASVGFERFLPQSWNGSSLAFTYSRVEQLQNPKYAPGTDILVDQAVQQTMLAEREKNTPEAVIQARADSVRLRTQTLSVSETYALPTIRLVVPIDYWLVTETINKLSLSYSFTRSTQRTPVTESYSQWQWNARASYGLQFSDKNYVAPFMYFRDFFLVAPWKDLKIYFSPRSFNVSTTFTRGQVSEQAWDQSIPKPTVRNFVAGRSMAFAWQFVDGGLLNLGTDYSLDVQSTLLNFEVDQFGRQRSFSQILSDMFGQSKLIDFGTDLNYGQSININPRIVVPKIWDLDRMLLLTAHYSTRYDWQNNLQAGSLGKSAASSGMLTASVDLNLKTIGEQIWSSQLPQPSAPDTGSVRPSFDLAKTLERVSRILFKIPIFDFEKLNVQFNQQNRVQNSGIVGRPGFANMFNRVPFFQSSLPENGPSLMYQLGLSSDPNGEVFVKTTGKFPFLTGYTIPGIRAPNGNLADIYSQSNRITMSTNRALWEGASININWNVGWNYNVNRTLQSDSLGFTTVNSLVVSGDVDRSFLSFPSFLMFKFLKTSIDEVEKRYVAVRDDPNDTRPNDAKISEAFEGGLEAIPLAKKLLGNLVPRPNWTFRWDGLEKLPLLSSFVTRVSVDHQYTSGLRTRWRIDPAGNEITESQSVSYGFAPLIGVTITFKPLLKGNFTGGFRYGTTTNYDLAPSAQNVVQADQTEITVNAGFARQGFEIPFFGFSLSNDIEITFSYSYSKSTRRVYDFGAPVFKPEGTPLEGSSRTSMDPRIRYILSSRVTASVYYKYTKLAPDAGGSRIPGSTTNEGGLDVRIAIQP